MKKFPCTMCGACCMNLTDGIKTARTLGLNFPYKIDSTGRCEKLDSDNVCEVYDDRPVACNIDKVRALLNLPQTEYFRATIEECNKLMDQEGIHFSYRIPLDGKKP